MNNNEHDSIKGRADAKPFQEYAVRCSYGASAKKLQNVIRTECLGELGSRLLTFDCLKRRIIMTRVEAIIRPNKLNAVKAALGEFG